MVNTFPIWFSLRLLTTCQELFPKLGYYFLVFKAIESERTRDRLDKLARKSVDSLPSTNVGVIAEDLIYLVVLRDGRGICTVRFSLHRRRSGISRISLVPLY